MAGSRSFWSASIRFTLHDLSRGTAASTTPTRQRGSALVGIIVVVLVAAVVAVQFARSLSCMSWTSASCSSLSLL